MTVRCDHRASMVDSFVIVLYRNNQMFWPAIAADVSVCASWSIISVTLDVRMEELFVISEAEANL